MNKVYIIGVGPGAPRYITGEAAEAIRQSGIVVGWEFDLLPPAELIKGKTVFLQKAGDYTKPRSFVAWVYPSFPPHESIQILGRAVLGLSSRMPRSIP